MECVGHDYDLFWMKYEGTQVFRTSMGWHNLTHAQQGQSGPTVKLKEGKLRIREPVWELCNNPEMMVAFARLVPVEVGKKWSNSDREELKGFAGKLDLSVRGDESRITLRFGAE